MYTTVNYQAASLGASAAITNGFLVTEYGNTGTGSLLGWDFNDINAAANARMLIGLDIEIFGNGQGWTENMATYLAGDSKPVPEPATMFLFGTGLAGLAGLRRKKK
jgi:hypothetical protein